MGSSPHTRGALSPDNASRSQGRIIPAYAGSTLEARVSIAFSQDHPRIRGEHGQHARDSVGEAGSSPHTRGARRPARPILIPTRIIPAYAGSTSVSFQCSARGPDHPRIRGEHDIGPGDLVRLVGSSPHTRGARAVAAGATMALADHPRIRGEHILVTSLQCFLHGSSPHTRGAPWLRTGSIL